MIYEEIVTKLASPYLGKNDALHVEPWRACSFTYLFEDICYIYYGSPGFFDGKKYYFNDSYYETDDILEGIVYLVAHELAHRNRIRKNRDYTHGKEWKKEYDRLIEEFMPALESLKIFKNVLFDEMLLFQKQRKKKIEEFIKICTNRSVTLRKNMTKQEIADIVQKLKNSAFLDNWIYVHERNFICNCFYENSLDFLGI